MTVNMFSALAGGQLGFAVKQQSLTDIIAQKGFRQYAADINREKLEAEIRKRVLDERGLDEEKLAQLQKTLPPQEYDALVNDIDRLIQAALEKLLAQGSAASSYEDKQKEREAQNQALPSEADTKPSGQAKIINVLI